MIEGSGSISLTNIVDPDPGGPKTYGSYRSGSGFRSATLLCITLICPIQLFFQGFHINFLDDRRAQVSFKTITLKVITFSILFGFNEGL
jgi:hypothetical protein